MNEFVSVIVRTKNEAKWIGACLHALSNQDYKNYEIILVDNESTDDTVKISQQYSCKLVKISDEEFNFSKALNMGIPFIAD